jgi:hypothetical protein
VIGVLDDMEDLMATGAEWPRDGQLQPVRRQMKELMETGWRVR